MAKTVNLLTRWLTSINSNGNANRIKKPISYWTLFRYATPLDYIVMAIALVLCAVNGVLNSLYVVVYADLVAMLVDRNFGMGASTNTITLSLFGGGKHLVNATHEENMAELRNDSWAFGTIMIIIAIVVFTTASISVDLMNSVGLRMILKMRKAFFEATIRKDVEWHDGANNQNFTLNLTDSMEKIRIATSEKLVIFIYLMIYSATSVIIAFVQGFKLTLSAVGLVFITLIGNIIATKFQKKFTEQEQSAYMKAGNLAEEIISAIRTVVAFCGEKLESSHYDKFLVLARKAGKWRGFISGIGYTIPRCMLFILAGEVLWYGAFLTLDERQKIDRVYTPAVTTLVFYGIAIAIDNAARFSTYLDCFIAGVVSAGPIFEVIDSIATIDPLSLEGKTLSNRLKGDVEFKDVFFKYPSRDDANVLRGLNLKVKAGQTVAIVGHSGCGKSTCLQLVERFYDPVFGNITLDGLDIGKYNVSWLRSNIAIVGQEPVLFQGTIGENIRYGKPEATREDIELASQSTGIHDFISQLPHGYDTSITEKGVQLSGGQKQRIAIARALISNPTILLLDEATSALDYHSEKLVQKAINSASKNRTTIVVSHRLSAIKSADRIIFIHDGKAVENGSHDELMNLRGKYFEMVKTFKLSADDFDENDRVQNEEIFSEHTNNNLNKHFENKHRLSTFFLTEKNIEEHEKSKDQTAFMETFIRVIKTARQNWVILVIAMIGASIFGCAHAALSMIFGEYFEALAEPDAKDVLRRTSFVAILSLVFAVISGIACFSERCFFNLVGIELGTKLRSLGFKTIIAQEIGWFDDKQNSVGALSVRLSGDVACVQDVIGYPFSGLIQATTNLLSSIAIAFYFSWQLALACLSTVPLMMGSVFFEAIYMGRKAELENKILQEISQFATEAIANIRTIAGLRREPQLIADYNKKVADYTTQLRKSLRFRGVVYASQYSTMYLGNVVGITYGGFLCSEGVIKVGDIMRVGGVLLYGVVILAMSLTLSPAFVSGIIAANRVFRMLDRKPQIKSMVACDQTPAIQKSSNAVYYKDISFQYPNRPDVKVLKGFNFQVLQGKTVAIVGPSGCGKSTLIQLLLRYYDPIRGEIFLEDQNIHRDLTLTTLRSRLGIVSQEPTLFEKTIAENIAYGDNFRNVTMSEIIEASKLANAFSFITALPNGFETKLGTRGTQLSGGQKQRIAIARALVRNPQVLLLDEATSALDFQSERIVQSALDRACLGRTSIIIAHRLSTIQNADLIYVVQDGFIVEQGNHSQLLDANGLYAKLFRSQPVD